MNPIKKAIMHLNGKNQTEVKNEMTMKEREIIAVEIEQQKLLGQMNYYQYV